MSDIQSLHRAFNILQIISQDPLAARPSAIAAQTGLPKTTVLRMLSTLENIGAVVRDAGSSSYQIGSFVQELAHPKPSHKQLNEAARPFMQQLAYQTGETVYLSVEMGDQVYYVDQIDAQHHILLRNWVGISFPLHTTAPGKLLLAYWSDEKIELYLNKPLAKYTSKTVVDTAVIRSYISEIRGSGVAWTHGQTEEALVGVAAPIFFQDGLVVGSISLGGPSFRFPPNGQEADMAQQLMEIANQISLSLQTQQSVLT